MSEHRPSVTGGSDDPSDGTPTCEWQYFQPEGWAEKVAHLEQRVLDDGSTVRLAGECPRCEHWMDIEIPVEARTGVSVTRVKDNQRLEARRALVGPKRPKDFELVVFCNCGAHHPERPAEFPHGCGAFGKIVVG